MNESRVFMLNGTDVQKIVTRLEGFFRTEKGMKVQSSETTEGYVMQARQPKDSGRIKSAPEQSVCLLHGRWRSPPEWVHSNRKSYRARCFRSSKLPL